MVFKTKNWFTLVLLTLLYLSAWIIQSSLLPNRDVAWDLEITARVLHGGKYIDDFFDVSPPSTFYLYFLPVVFAKLLSLNIFLVTRFYFFLLISLSLFICYFLIKKIFLPIEQTLAQVFLFSLASIFLILPVFDLGQRDHLFLVLIMPYVFLMIYRLQGGAASTTNAILIGLMAGFGFAIKPFFVITLFMLEIYYLICKRKLFACLRVETITIAIVLIAYLLYVFIIHSNYINLVLPLLFAFYYPSVGYPLSILAAHPFAIYCCFPLLFYIILYQHNQHKNLFNVLWLTSLGTLLSYFLQQQTWFYHLIPAFSIALLLFIFLYYLLITQSKVIPHNYLLLIISAVIFFSYLFWANFFALNVINPNPLAFFAFLSGLVAVLIWLDNSYKKLLLTFSLFLFALSIYLMVFYLNQIKNIWCLSYPLLTLTTLSIYACFVISITHRNLLENIFIVLLGMLLILFPIFSIGQSYIRYQALKEPLNKLIDFLQQHAHNKPVYFFSTTVVWFPLVNYSGAIPATRFAHLVFMPELLKTIDSARDPLLQQKQVTVKKLYTSMVTEDLNHYRPQLIFVRCEDRGIGANTTKENIDFIGYFSQDAHFREAFKAYHYLTTIEDASFGAVLYKFKVYERKA